MLLLLFIVSFTLEGDVATSKSVIDGLKNYLTERVPTDTMTGFKFSELTDTSVALVYSVELVQRIVSRNPEPAANASYYASKLNVEELRNNFTSVNVSFVQGFNQFKAARLEAKVFQGPTLNLFLNTTVTAEEVERLSLKYLSDVTTELDNSATKTLELVSTELLFYNPEIYSVVDLQLKHTSMPGTGYKQIILGKTLPSGEIADDPVRSLYELMLNILKYLGFVEFAFFVVEFILELASQIRNTIRDRVLQIEAYEIVNGLYFLVMVIHLIYFVRIQQNTIKNPTEPLVSETTYAAWTSEVAQQKALQDIQGMLMVLACLRLIKMLMAKFYELFQLLKVTLRKTGRPLISFMLITGLVFLSFVFVSVLCLPHSEPIYSSFWETASILLQSILGQPEFTTTSLKRIKPADILFTVINILFFLFFTAFAFEYLLGMQYQCYYEVQKKYHIPILVKYRFLESRNLTLANKFWYLITFQFKTKDFDAEERKRTLSRLVERGEFTPRGKFETADEDYRRSNSKATITSFKTPMSKMDRISPIKQSVPRSLSMQVGTQMSPGGSSPFASPTKQKLQAILKQNQAKSNFDLSSKGPSRREQQEASKHLLDKTELQEIFTMNLANFVNQGEESFYSRNLYLKDVQWISAAVKEEIVSDYRERIDEYKETLVTNFATCILYVLYIWLYSTISTRHLNVLESQKFNLAYEGFVNQSTFNNSRYVGLVNFNTMRVFTDLQDLVSQPTFITNNLTYNERPTFLIGRLAKQTYFLADNYYNTSSAPNIVHWMGANKRLESRTELANVYAQSLQTEFTLLESSQDQSVGVWTYLQNPQLTPQTLLGDRATADLKILTDDMLLQFTNDTNPFISREVDLFT